MGWKAFSALPNYRGGKRRLCPAIFREIAAVHPTRTWPDLTLLDPFMGGGSIALYAKAQGFKVLANDLARRCYLVGKGIVENNHMLLTDEDVGLLFSERNSYDRFVERCYVPQTFCPKIARFLDLALANLRDADLEEMHEALLYTSLLRYMLMARTGGQLTNRIHMTRIVQGDFDAMSEGFRRNVAVRAAITPPSIRMRHVQRHINGGIFAGQARVFREDAMTWMPEHPADVAYLDPPYYGSSSYEANYYLLDCILEGKKLPRYQHSPFNRRETAWMSLVQMFEAANHVATWVFSFAANPGGFSRKQLCNLIENFDRRPKVIPLQHRWSLATEGDHYEAGAKELLIIAVPS